MTIKKKRLVTNKIRNTNKLESSNDDKLGFTEYTKPLVEYLNSYGNLPITVGIYGDWGSGKSVFIDLLSSEIHSSSNNKSSEFDKKSIIFDAWEYREEKQLWKPLIKKILDSLNPSSEIKEKDFQSDKQNIIDSMYFNRKKKDYFKLKSKSTFKASVFLSICIVIFLIAVVLNTKYNINQWIVFVVSILAIIIPSIYSTYKLFEVEREAPPLNSSADIHDKLNKIISNSNIKGKNVIIIENIDRCLPRVGLNLLESIASILNFDKFIYIIACDPRVIEGEIKNVYHDKDISSVDYLNKIFDIHFYLPEMEPQRLKEYLIPLINDGKYIPQDSFKNHIKKILKIFNRFKIYNARDIKIILARWDIAYWFIQHSNKDNIDIYKLLNLIIMRRQDEDIYKYFQGLSYQLINGDNEANKVYKDIQEKMNPDVFVNYTAATGIIPDLMKMREKANSSPNKFNRIINAICPTIKMTGLKDLKNYFTAIEIINKIKEEPKSEPALKVKELAETLLHSGLAASKAHAIERAKDILGIKEFGKNKSEK